jgi:hypothetical protein
MKAKVNFENLTFVPVSIRMFALKYGLLFKRFLTDAVPDLQTEERRIVGRRYTGPPYCVWVLPVRAGKAGKP